MRDTAYQLLQTFASNGKINPSQNLGELNYCTVFVLLKPGLARYTFGVLHATISRFFGSTEESEEQKQNKS